MKNNLLLIIVSSVFCMTAHAGMGKKHKFAKDGRKGPCHQMECRQLEKSEAQQNCIQKKKQCRQDFFVNQLEAAEKDGISQKKKQFWTSKLQRKIDKKQSKGASDQEISVLKANLERVNALKATEKHKN